MLEELLEKKKKILGILYKLALKFKKILFVSDFNNNIVNYINRRERILNELNRIDTELERAFLINKKNKGNYANTIKELNLLLNDLIQIEKENEIMLDKMLELKSGKYIDNYKKFNK